MTDALKRLFRPEFLNRVDEVVVFNRLGEENLLQITQLLLKDLEKRVTEAGATLTVTEEAKRCIARVGFDAEYGARPLRRTIGRLIEDPLALLLIETGAQEERHFVAEATEGSVQIRKKDEKKMSV